MTTSFTKEEMLQRKGCYSRQKLDSLPFMSTDTITIKSILESEISLKDKSWFIRNSCDLSFNEKRKFDIGCALVVLPIYENKYPNNSAPRKAIEADKLYLNNEISIDKLEEFKRSAYAASYAADADAAAYAAADADAYAAADVNYKDLLLMFFKEFFNCK